MKKFIQDILRDKGSNKYSITKTLAIFFTLILTAYLTFITVTTRIYDEMVIVQLLGTILTLVGYKNSFGFGKSAKSSSVIEALDQKIEKVVDDKKDEANF